jgi:hypothetical protein
MYELPDWLITFSQNSRLFRPKALALLFVIIVTIVGGIVLYKYTRPTPPSQAWQCQHAAEAANPIAAENSCPGTNSWRLDHSTGDEHAIEGFTAPVSANVGENVKLYTSTTASTYTFQVYRMGWYQGLGGHLVYSSALLRGINQPPPTIDPTTRMVSCSNWHDPVILAIPATWVSGVYVVKLLSSAGHMRYTSFVVRNDAGSSPILFQTSVLTYQAYNMWGGYSLYGGLNAKGESFKDRAYVVSFDRPLDRGAGLGDFPLYSEYNLLRWFEREGYDISYTTDVDTDMHGPLLLQHRLFIAAGHDEYWSAAMRDHVTFARDEGVSLAFFGANDIYWHVRLQSSPLGTDREVICYKQGYSPGAVDPIYSIDPREVTVRWRDEPLNEPENALLGAMYAGGVYATAPLDLSIGAKPFLSGTMLHVGSALSGLVGGEYDRIYQNGVTPSSLSVIASSPLRCTMSSRCSPTNTDTADATLYTSPGGARVFDAGTFYWGWGLDDDPFYSKNPARSYSTPAFRQFTTNLLAYLLK